MRLEESAEYGSWRGHGGGTGGRLALEQAARRARPATPLSGGRRRLRQGADLVQRFGRGPMADRLGRRPATATSSPQSPPASQHGG